MNGRPRYQQADNDGAYDPREPLPRWGVGRWLFASIGVASALFWIWLAIHVYVAVFS